MKRSVMKWVGLTTTAALLAAGCAARTPDQRPGGAQQMGLTGNTAGSTTGDADACAVALGNSVATGFATDATNRAGMGGAAGTNEVTANGVLIGNVALVGLPTADEMNISPRGPGGTLPGGMTAPAPGGAATPTPAPAGSAAASDDVRARPNPVAPLAPAGQPLPPGGAFDRTATPGPVGFGGTTTGAGQMAQGETGTPPGVVTPAGRPDMAPAPGAGAAPGGAGAGAGAGARGNAANVSAIDRIQAACPKVAQIRVVNDSGDRATLARIAMAIRKGEPITNFMQDLSRISDKATVAGAGANATGQPGEGAAGAGAGGAGAPGAATPGGGTPGTAPPAGVPAVPDLLPDIRPITPPARTGPAAP